MLYLFEFKQRSELGLPGGEFHKFTQVGDRVDDKEGTVPETNTGKHGTEVKVKVLAYTKDNCKTEILLIILTVHKIKFRLVTIVENRRRLVMNVV